MKYCNLIYNFVTIYTLCWIVFQYHYNLFRLYQQMLEL